MRSEMATAQCLRRVLSVRRGREKIATHREEDADMAAMHFLDRLDRIGAGLSWWHEAKFVAEFLHELFIHPLPHTHGAIALHIGIHANRTRDRAGPANIPTEQQEVDDFLYGSDSVPVLRKAHRPAADDS